MKEEKEINEALDALERYDVTVLTHQRRLLLGSTLVDLENRKIRLQTAKTRLYGNILFNRSILDALEKAAGK
ncbi:hypothetical protein H0N95_00485 [Candidatus Micrarchaeota archaeon]|nr:hypothetical protein [Candidatus Micrarchaeota archaeon]